MSRAGTIPARPAAAASFQSGVRSMQTTHKTTLMLRAKVVVVGDSWVGKTAVVQMFKSGGHDYPKNYIMVRESMPRGCISVCSSSVPTLVKSVLLQYHAVVRML